MVALHPALGAAVVDQVGLEPEDRLDPVRPAGLVVLDRAVHHPVVGEPERRHPELRRAGGHRLDLAGAVEQRVLAVDVQVNAPARSSQAGRRQRRSLPLPARIRNVIWLLRHGEAEDAAEDDAARRLTEGRAQARAAGAALAALGVRIDAA